MANRKKTADETISEIELILKRIVEIQELKKKESERLEKDFKKVLVTKDSTSISYDLGKDRWIRMAYADDHYIIGEYLDIMLYIDSNSISSFRIQRSALKKIEEESEEVQKLVAKDYNYLARYIYDKFSKKTKVVIVKGVFE